MPRLALTGGSYQARSVIASAQRSLNLFPEPLPQQQGEPSMFAHYPTPGLGLLGTLPTAPIRGIRQATSGELYVVAGSGVYLVNTTTWAGTLLGNITGGLTTPVSMQDNTLTMVIVDGSSSGWTVDLSSHAFAAISDPSGLFSGADRVNYIDTYLVFNKPGTPQFYSSESLAVTFDNLFFANKSSYTDKLVTLAVAKREIWLLGERTTEIWYDLAGGSTTDISAGFPFSEIPSTFIDHGCAAKYSVATYDNSVFWLTADRSGTGFVMQGAGYQNKRISTFALEQAWADYLTIADAIGMIYLLGGHIVYVLTFPTADHTWCYDVNTSLWHEWLWVDSSGNEHRHRANCCYNVSGTVVVGDWQNGNLYALDHNTFTDNGQPIRRQRSYPHILNDGKRMFYREFIADIETGNAGPLSHASTLIKCLFNGPDGTPVENYSPSATEINATWYAVNGSATLAANAAVSQSGYAVYASNGPFPPSADYSIAFRVLPQPMTGDGSAATVTARGSTAGGGYVGGIEIVGGIWAAVLQSSYLMAIGQPPPDGWYDCMLIALGTTISLTIQRSNDGNYLGPDGGWHSGATAAIAIVDSSFPAPGMIQFNLNDLVTGVMGTEDATGTWILEDGSSFSWEWDDLPTNSLGIDNIIVIQLPSPWQLGLDWSDDRGHTFGNIVWQSMGGAGDYLTSVQWQRLGYARDRCFRLTWTSPLKTALQGAFVEAQPALT